MGLVSIFIKIEIADNQFYSFFYVFIFRKEGNLFLKYQCAPVFTHRLGISSVSPSSELLKSRNPWQSLCFGFTPGTSSRDVMIQTFKPKLTKRSLSALRHHFPPAWHIRFLGRKELKKWYQRPALSKHLKGADVQMPHTQFIVTTKPGNSNEMAIWGNTGGYLQGSLTIVIIRGKAKEKVRRAFNFAESRTRAGRGNMGKKWIFAGVWWEEFFEHHEMSRRVTSSKEQMELEELIGDSFSPRMIFATFLALGN